MFPEKIRPVSRTELALYGTLIVKFMPYIIGGAEQLTQDNPSSSSLDAGLDVKYRLSSNLTADITYNTDFAQVEADQEQFNLTRFSLFFPEKRGFFLEGYGEDSCAVGSECRVPDHGPAAIRRYGL